MENSNHALIIGGSGMLRKVSIHLAKQGFCVSVIGRNMDKLQKLELEAINFTGSIIPICVDYTDNNKLRDSIKKIINDNGPISIIIAWIHTPASEAIETVINEIDVKDNKCFFFHVLGSSDTDKLVSEIKMFSDKYQKSENIYYHQIVLGQIKKEASSRWLTNDEISLGVINAISKKKKIYLVGEI